MKRIILVLLLVPTWGVAQVILQPWVEVFGTVNGQQLGKYVAGITPSTNLPYKAAVSKVGSTGIYRLNTPSDTSIQQVFFGENLLTGDLNNDGFKDVVVSKTVNGYDTVSIYWGTSTGIDTLSSLRIPGEGQFDGLVPACIGDINNDTISDLILRAPGYGLDNGKVYIFLGPITSSTLGAEIVGDSTRFGLGWAAVAIADLNDDGFNDLIIRGKNQSGPPGPQRYDYLNISWGIGVDTLNLTLDLQMRTADILSYGLACFDVNGDGISDLLWTVHDTATFIGVHYGSSAFDTISSIRLQDPGVSAFGFNIANIGDVNGDGYRDVAVGCPYATVTQGIVFVFCGGPQIDGVYDARRSLSTDARFGWSLSASVDVNGDGLTDIIVGAPLYPFGDNKGYWAVLLGDSTIRVTSVNQGVQLPQLFALRQAYPNPFNPVATIQYQLLISSFVRIEVFNILGQAIFTLVNEFKQPGQYETQFDGSFLPSGVYYYRMTARPKEGSFFSETKSITLIK